MKNTYYSKFPGLQGQTCTMYFEFLQDQPTLGIVVFNDPQRRLLVCPM